MCLWAETTFSETPLSTFAGNCARRYAARSRHVQDHEYYFSKVLYTVQQGIQLNP